MGGPANERLGGSREARRHELPDFYEQLEISPHASQDVIQAAYRALVRTHHPDVNASPQAAHRILLLNAAYRVLSDPEQRARYDLECLRARRHERLTHPEPAAESSRVVPQAARRGSRQQVDDDADRHFPALNGQVVLGLLAVAVIAAIVLGLLWTTLDAAGESAPPNSGPTVEWTRH